MARRETGWTPEVTKALISEFHEQRQITRQLVSVLRDVHDELAALRTELRFIRTESERLQRITELVTALEKPTGETPVTKGDSK